MLNKVKGFILMEVLLSVVIFSIGSIALLSLLAVSVADANQAKYRNQAANLATTIISQGMMDITNRAQYGDGNGYAPRASWNVTVGNSLPCYLCGTVSVAEQTNIVVTGNTLNVVVRWRTRDEVAKNAGIIHEYQTFGILQTSE